MRTITLLVTVALGILAAPLAADSQPPKKVPRIGILSGALATFPSLRLEVFLQGPRDLGYVEGQNILIERRLAGGKLERLPDLAADLVRLQVDIQSLEVQRPDSFESAFRAATRERAGALITLACCSDPRAALCTAFSGLAISAAKEV